jgi:hypothetical protein
MQTSEKRVFLFVEGRDQDPYFYGKIAREVLTKKALPYQICRADEIKGSSVGKSRLLTFFSWLRQNDYLGGTFKGKSWFGIFYLDKDIDDVLASLVISEHVVYTPYYAIENHIYCVGKLREASAACMSLDVEETPAAFADSFQWRRRCAHLWQEWVVLCLLVAKLQVKCECGYSRPSQLNKPSCASADPALFATFAEDIRTRSGLSQEDFNNALNAARAEVAKIYAANEFDKIFKGKWYAAILQADLDAHVQGPVPNKPPLELITRAIAATVDASEEWAKPFVAPLEQLCERFAS